LFFECLLGYVDEDFYDIENKSGVTQLVWMGCAGFDHNDCMSIFACWSIAFYFETILQPSSENEVEENRPDAKHCPRTVTVAPSWMSRPSPRFPAIESSNTQITSESPLRIVTVYKLSFVKANATTFPVSSTTVPENGEEEFLSTNDSESVSMLGCSTEDWLTCVTVFVAILFCWVFTVELHPVMSTDEHKMNN